MYTTLDLVNFLDNSDDNSDEESYENFNTMYCENDNCYNIFIKPFIFYTIIFCSCYLCLFLFGKLIIDFLQTIFNILT